MDNRYVIVNGLPYLLADKKTYAVRWDDKGFTVGAEVKLASVPDVTHSELSVKAKCADHLDSISSSADGHKATSNDAAAVDSSVEKPKAPRKKKAVSADDPDNK